MRKLNIFAAALGLLIAVVTVSLWYPKVIWELPIQGFDAPSHYYFIQQLNTHGISKVFRLLPNGDYYPPLFSLLACGLMKFLSVFGVQVNVFAALNTTWIIVMGLLYPAGMLLCFSYFCPSKLATTPRLRIALAILYVLFPVLSVSFAAFPYSLLEEGPLIAYALGMAIIPYMFYCSWRCLDALNSRKSRMLTSTSPWFWLILLLTLTSFVFLAQPRVIFAYFVFIVPFILLRMPRKMLYGLAGLCVVAGVGLFVVSQSRYKSAKYFHPSEWFHTFVPSKTFANAGLTILTGGQNGLNAILVTTLLLCGVGILLAYLYNSYHNRTVHLTESEESTPLSSLNIVAVIIMLALVASIYLASASLTGIIANILTAVFYRTETRTIIMLPIAILIVWSAAAGVLLQACQQSSSDQSRSFKQLTKRGNHSIALILLVVLITLTVLAQAYNPSRNQISHNINRNATLSSVQASDQLNTAKYQVLKDVTRITSTYDTDQSSLVISDPSNASMYAYSLFKTPLLYPVLNPLHERGGHIFADVEIAFASRDPSQVLNTACPITNGAVYFLDMGPSSQTLDHLFQFNDQYAPFHDEEVINLMIHEGAMVKVSDYSQYGNGWALYKLHCR